MVWGSHQAQQSWQDFSDAQKNLNCHETNTLPSGGSYDDSSSASAKGLRECCELAASNCPACDLTSPVQPAAWAADTVTYLISAVQLAEYGQVLSAIQTSQKQEFQ